MCTSPMRTGYEDDLVIEESGYDHCGCFLHEPRLPANLFRRAERFRLCRAFLLTSTLLMLFYCSPSLRTVWRSCRFDIAKNSET